jgi:hypothetical protein
MLEGMDYCLDWKLDESEWSVRELVYHILETPPGGAQNLVKGILAGAIDEYEIWSDLTNITPERSVYDLPQINADIEGFFRSLAASISGMADEDLEGKKVMMHQRTRGVDEQRTLNAILERTLNGHIRDHLTQIQAIRDALAI